MRRCHALRHGAPHPAQCLGRTCLGETFGGPLDVGARDGAAGSGGLYGVEIDIELACESTHRRKHLKHSRRCRFGRSLGHRSLLLAGVELADHGAGILLGALGKLDQRRADFHEITLGPEQPRDAAAPRRRHFNHGLVGLDRDERLVRNHVIPLVHVPGDDLGLLETFAKIRQHELSHEMCSADLN